MHIRASLPTEAARLTDLVLTAKAHWGYSDRQLELWRESLTVTEEQVVTQPIFVAEDDGVVGFYSLKFFNGVCELDNLWVVPTEMGRGYGAALLAHAAAVAKRRGVQQIRIDADPNAEAFYIRYGATITGLVPAPIDEQPARVRPQLLLST
jgi:GNAT superfamily N-acetyltransferase